MEIRRFGRETQRNYIRDVGRFATFLGRSPDTATAEEVGEHVWMNKHLSAHLTAEKD